MIPILDQNNNPIPNSFKNTRADIALEEYKKDLAINIAGNIIPVYRFIEMYLRIKDKNGRFSVFEMNDAQIDFYKQLCIQKRNHKPMRINILKARQLGFSTFIAAVIFVLTILVPNQTACIIADTGEHATNLFRKYQFYYANLPKKLKDNLPLLRSNAKELAVNYGNGQTSIVRVVVAGENAGRSDSCQYLHLSEVAFWKDITDTVTSVMQTVSDTNENSIIAYETTANGVNEYKETWDYDVAEKGNFKALFYAWFLDSEYKYRYDGFELFDWEKDLMAEFNLSLDQIAWYRVQYNKLHGNLKKLQQEYPSRPVEAFITSGNSVFNAELLLKRKDELMKVKPIKKGFFTFSKESSLDGSQITISNIKWVDSPIGEISIYEEPDPSMPYVVSNDPAMMGEDYFATQVVNNYTGCQAAVYHKNKCDADECAYQMYCLGVYYNNAMITGETNTTSYLLKLIYKCGYRFIYQDQDYDSLSGRFQDKFGFKTKQNNRQTMIDLFAEAFRDNPNIIRDYETICEMENFQVVRNESTGKEKAQATSGKHDDLVMSMCGYYLCKHMQRSIPNKIETNINKNYIYDPYKYYKQKEKKNQERNVYQIWD